MNENTNRSEGARPALERSLDALADRERALPDDGFEARLLEGVRRGALEPLGEPIAIGRSARWRGAWPLAVAACVLLVLTAGFMLWGRTPALPGPERVAVAGPDAATEVDEFIETVAWLDESLPELAGAPEDAGLGTIDELVDEVEQTLRDDEESI
jgi:hypothetical protein